ncbi:MAG: GNAT family N-acetyltransferase [Ruminococcus sp.]|nr:GNAT family N-acetyltransferase [Ruminococcus sp.]MBR1753142.1 GNAT family N-acetyltransferase [Ruminococcus sp.]
MIFEKADTDDIKELVELRIAYLLEDHGGIPQSSLSLIAEKLPEYFREHLNNDLLVFVCRNENSIVSCCFLYISEKPPNPSFISGKTGTVLNVYTRPQFRRKGIAAELIRALLKEAKAKELDYVELKATDAGYGFYKSLGFEDMVSKYHNMKYIIDDRNEL